MELYVSYKYIIEVFSPSSEGPSWAIALRMDQNHRRLCAIVEQPTTGSALAKQF
jgi:hypothetical protein